MQHLCHRMIGPFPVLKPILVSTGKSMLSSGISRLTNYTVYSMSTITQKQLCYHMYPWNFYLENIVLYIKEEEGISMRQ